MHQDPTHVSPQAVGGRGGGAVPLPSTWSIRTGRYVNARGLARG